MPNLPNYENCKIKPQPEPPQTEPPQTKQPQTEPPQTELNKILISIEKVKARQKAYRSKNREKYNEFNKNYRLLNADKIKLYRTNNKEKIKQQTIKYKLNKALLNDINLIPIRTQINEILNIEPPPTPTPTEPQPKTEEEINKILNRYTNIKKCMNKHYLIKKAKLSKMYEKFNLTPETMYDNFLNTYITAEQKAPEFYKERKILFQTYKKEMLDTI